MGLLSCVKPEHAPSKKDIIADLERKRANLEETLNRQSKQLTQAEAKQESWIQLQAEYEKKLADKTKRACDLLARCKAMEAEAIDFSESVNVSVRAYEEEVVCDSGSGKSGKKMGQDFGSHDNLLTPEDQLASAVATLDATRLGLIKKIQSLTEVLHTQKSTSLDLEKKIEMGQEKNKLLDLRCSTLEKENAALTGWQYVESLCILCPRYLIFLARFEQGAPEPA
jgi:hypothetical protein